jgi:hypothetical protein
MERPVSARRGSVLAMTEGNKTSSNTTSRAMGPRSILRRQSTTTQSAWREQDNQDVKAMERERARGTRQAESCLTQRETEGLESSRTTRPRIAPELRDSVSTSDQFDRGDSSTNSLIDDKWGRLFDRNGVTTRGTVIFTELANRIVRATCLTVVDGILVSRTDQCRCFRFANLSHRTTCS